MKLEITDVKEEGDNYLVTLKGSLGNLIKIWVPKEDSPDYFSFVWDKPEPIGLNLVTIGHYV